jgi:hypothetical protein
MYKKLGIRLILIFLLAGLFLTGSIGVMSTSIDRMSLCNLGGQPGETIVTTITLFGTESETRTGYWDTYYKQVDSDNDHMDITPWITIQPKEFSIAKDESKVFNISIILPQNTEPGLWGATSVNAGDSGHSAERRTYIIFKDTAAGGNVYSGLMIPISVQVTGKVNPFTGIINFLSKNVLVIVLVVIIVILATFLLVRLRHRN